VKKGFWFGGTALAVGLLAGGFLMGDDKKPDEPTTKLKGKLPAHFRKLGLSDQQMQQIFKIEAGYTDKVEALQKQLVDLKKAEHQEIDAVLTEEQKTHLKELLTADVNSKDKTEGKDKTTVDVKDKPVEVKTKDKPVVTDKDKGPPAKDKEK
jgi:hypothetical protein